MKTYVLMISRTFMKSHPRAGQETHFMSKILLNSDLVVVQDDDGCQFVSKSGWSSKMAAEIVRQDFYQKIHTLRPNYNLWAHRAEEINAGRAVLSLRQWSGKPYRSKQKEFLKLEKIGVQKIEFNRFLGAFIDDTDVDVSLDMLAKNDGLSVDDFKAWFKDLKYDEPYAIIQFTDFVYQ